MVFSMNMAWFFMTERAELVLFALQGTPAALSLSLSFFPDSESYGGSYFKCIGRSTCVCFGAWVLVSLQGAAPGCCYEMSMAVCTLEIGCWSRCRLPVYGRCHCRALPTYIFILSGVYAGVIFGSRLDDSHRPFFTREAGHCRTRKL